MQKLLLTLIATLILLMLINVPMNTAKECSKNLSLGNNQDTNALALKSSTQRSQKVETTSDEIITAWGSIKSLY